MKPVWPRDQPRIAFVNEGQVTRIPGRDGSLLHVASDSVGRRKAGMEFWVDGPQAAGLEVRGAILAPGESYRIAGWTVTVQRLGSGAVFFTALDPEPLGDYSMPCSKA